MIEKNIKSEYFLKICVIGTSPELKNRFVRTFGEDKFADNYISTLGYDTMSKRIMIGEQAVKLILEDIACQEFFGKIRQFRYRGSSAGVIVFKKSDRKSFDDVTDWLEDFRKHTGAFQTITATEKKIHKVPKQLIKGHILPIALVGINTDSEDVSKDEGRALADLLDLHYFETSSPTFENINEIFVYLCKKVIK